jgi:hypothetical protein
MREAPLSLAYRLSWLAPAIGMVAFVLVVGPQLLRLSDPHDVLSSVGKLSFLVAGAVSLAKDALERRSL